MPEFKVGTRIVVADYGAQTVTGTGEDYVAVAFDDGREALVKRGAHAQRLATEVAVAATTREPVRMSKVRL